VPAKRERYAQHHLTTTTSPPPSDSEDSGATAPHTTAHQASGITTSWGRGSKESGVRRPSPGRHLQASSPNSRYPPPRANPAQHLQPATAGDSSARAGVGPGRVGACPVGASSLMTSSLTVKAGSPPSLQVGVSHALCHV